MKKKILYSTYNTILRRGLQKIIQEKLLYEPACEEIPYSSPVEVILQKAVQYEANVVVIDDYGGPEKTWGLITGLFKKIPTLTVIIFTENKPSTYRGIGFQDRLHFLEMHKSLDETKDRISQIFVL